MKKNNTKTDIQKIEEELSKLKKDNQKLSKKLGTEKSKNKELRKELSKELKKKGVKRITYTEEQEQLLSSQLKGMNILNLLSD